MIETAKEAAKRLAAPALAQGLKPVALHAYTDREQNVLYWRIRAKHPVTGEKWIRPMYINGNGFEVGEPKFERGKKPLYRLHRLFTNQTDAVWIVEGEQKADALEKLGLLAITSGGATSAVTTDWKPLRGRTAVIWPDNDDPGKSYAGEVATLLLAMNCAVSCVDVEKIGVPDKGDVVDWLATHQSADSGDILALPRLAPSFELQGAVRLPNGETQHRTFEADRIVLIRGDSIKPEPVRWLWEGWLARGKFHVLAGAPGTGKTTIALAVAATLSLGGRWPDGTHTSVGNIIIWSGEDDPSDTLAPRLLASGADMTRIHFISNTIVQGESRPFDPARDMATLTLQAAGIGEIRLLIVDPVVSAVAGDSHKNADTRRSLQPLVDLGATLDCAVLGISHYSKGTQGRDPVERVTGSIAFGALARVVWGTAKGTEEGQRRRLVRAKSNIGQDGGGFEYDLEQTEIPAHPGLFASRVLWCAAIEGGARELLAEAEVVKGEPSQLSDTTQWLRDLLSEEGGQLEKRIIIKIARENGFAERTVQRAREQLGITVTQSGFGKEKRSVWSIQNTGNSAIRANHANECQQENHGTHGMNEQVVETAEVF